MRDTLDNIKRGERFWLGDVIAIHEIAEFGFVEYVNHRDQRSGVSVFIQGVSIGMGATTLEDALLLALAYKYDGANSQAARLMRQMLGEELHTDYKNHWARAKTKTV